MWLSILVGIGYYSCSPIIVSEPACPLTQETWSHVWSPYRLKILQQCQTVTGTLVEAPYTEIDGDEHVIVRLDDQYTNLLNNKNNGTLIVEPICQKQPLEPIAALACGDYRQSIYIPAVGEHVKITGDVVLDLDHGWVEIHPVYSMERM